MQNRDWTLHHANDGAPKYRTSKLNWGWKGNRGTRLDPFDGKDPPGTLGPLGFSFGYSVQVDPVSWTSNVLFCYGYKKALHNLGRLQRSIGSTMESFEPSSSGWTLHQSIYCCLKLDPSSSVPIIAHGSCETCYVRFQFSLFMAPKVDAP